MFNYISPPGIHANAWITSATAIHLIHNLLTNCTEHCTYNWYFIPQVNPDGYEYSRIYDSTWVKNRFEVSAECTGVSINHNFPTPDNEQHLGGSSDCADDTYYGTEMSIETNSLRLARQPEKNILLSISLLSFGEKFVFPYARDKVIPVSTTEQYYNHLTYLFYADEDLGWDYGTYKNVIGIQDGTSMDYCKSQEGCAEHSIALFLRSSPEGGNPDASEILASADETLRGIYGVLNFFA